MIKRIVVVVILSALVVEVDLFAPVELAFLLVQDVKGSEVLPKSVDVGLSLEGSFDRVSELNGGLFDCDLGVSDHLTPAPESVVLAIALGNGLDVGLVAVDGHLHGSLLGFNVDGVGGSHCESADGSEVLHEVYFYYY